MYHTNYNNIIKHLTVDKSISLDQTTILHPIVENILCRLDSLVIT